MPITKITIQPAQGSYENKSVRYSKTFEMAHKDFREMADFMQRLAQFSSYVKQYPDEPAEKAIKAHFPDNFHRKDYTKKKRTFSSWFLTITEEDENKTP